MLDYIVEFNQQSTGFWDFLEKPNPNTKEILLGVLRVSNGARRGDCVQGGEREERRVGDRGQSLCAAGRKLSLHRVSERSLLMSISACTFSSSGCEGNNISLWCAPQRCRGRPRVWASALGWPIKAKHTHRCGCFRTKSLFLHLKSVQSRQSQHWAPGSFWVPQKAERPNTWLSSTQLLDIYPKDSKSQVRDACHQFCPTLFSQLSNETNIGVYQQGDEMWLLTLYPGMFFIKKNEALLLWGNGCKWRESY